MQRSGSVYVWLMFYVIYLFHLYLSQEISSAISVSWEVNYGYVCTGVNWDLFPSGVKDAKVNFTDVHRSKMDALF